MREHNLLEDLVAVSPGMEIWWDSSPVIFANWCEKMLAKADDGRSATTLKRQFARMYDTDDPMSQLFRGVTTNPPLSLAAIKDDPPYWQGVAQTHHQGKHGPRHRVAVLDALQGSRQARLRHVPAAVRGVGLQRGLPLRSVRPAQRLRQGGHAQAGRARSTRQSQRDGEGAPAPQRATSVIEELTSRGIATNNTLIFVAVAADGLREVRQARPREGQGQRRRPLATGARSSPTWRPATATSAACATFGKEKGIELTEGDVRLAELAIFKKAYRTAQGARLPSKMLSCSLRFGPDGRRRAAALWHLEEKAGARHRRHLPAEPSSTRSSTSRVAEDIKFEAEPHRRGPAQGRHGQAAADPVLRARLRRGRLHAGRVQHASRRS